MSSSPMPSTSTQLAVEKMDTDALEQKDSDAVRNDAKMTDSDYEDALKRAKADAVETAAALENLVEGIQAVKRILEHPIDMETNDTISCMSESSSDAKLVSELSNKLVGVLGSELIGLLNAAQMAKGHAKLRLDDDTQVVQELHRTREIASKLNNRVDRAESNNRRLKKEKKLLVKEVRTLQGDRKVLMKEVKSLRKKVQLTKQFDDWRLLKEHLRDATLVHESVLNNKTFTSGFDGIDPPGMVTEDVDMQERNNNDNEDDSTRVSATSDKENNVQIAYFPRKDVFENDTFDKVLKYTELKVKQAAVASESKPTPKSKSQPSKKSALPFSKGISTSLSSKFGRFKNALQDVSDQMRHHDNNNQDQHSRPEERTSPAKHGEDKTKKVDHALVERNTNIQESDNNCVSVASSTNENQCKPLDDEATKSTKSFSFDSGENNLSTSLMTCSDDEMHNDLALQISIDDGSSFLNIENYPNFMITPESSPLTEQSTNVLKPLCNPTVIRTLTIPGATARGETTESFPALKPRLHSFLVGS